jgi:hypothetical protein
VIRGVFGRDERAHGFVRDRALGEFGRGEQAGDDAAARTQDAGRLGQGLARVPSELERVDPGHSVERGVAERQRRHVTLAQVGAGQPLTGDAQQARADVKAGRARAALGGQHQGEAGSAAYVEQPGTGADARGVQHGLEQRAVVCLGQVGPGPRIGTPQPALHLGGGADRHAGGAVTVCGAVAGAAHVGLPVVVARAGPGGAGLPGAGVMFWFRRKMLPGS